MAGDVRDGRIAGEEGGGVGDEHQVLAGAEVGDGVGGGEGEADAVGEADPDQVERLRADVLQLDELEVLGVVCAGSDGVIHDFGDGQRRGGDHEGADGRAGPMA